MHVVRQRLCRHETQVPSSSAGFSGVVGGGRICPGMKHHARAHSLSDITDIVLWAFQANDQCHSTCWGSQGIENPSLTRRAPSLGGIAILIALQAAAHTQRLTGKGNLVRMNMLVMFGWPNIGGWEGKGNRARESWFVTTPLLLHTPAHSWSQTPWSCDVSP